MCFTGHGRGSTLTISCLASFLVLWRASSASPSSWRAKAGFRVDHECYGEVCLGESYGGQFGIPIFGWQPDYVESLERGTAQAAAMARAFGIIRDAAYRRKSCGAMFCSPALWQQPLTTYHNKVLRNATAPYFFQICRPRGRFSPPSRPPPRSSRRGRPLAHVGLGTVLSHAKSELLNAPDSAHARS
jgi:hypothetical protein